MYFRIPLSGPRNDDGMSDAIWLDGFLVHGFQDFKHLLGNIPWLTQKWKISWTPDKNHNIAIGFQIITLIKFENYWKSPSVDKPTWDLSESSKSCQRWST